MEVLVLQAGNIDGDFETLVGVYSTFDKTVAAADAYCAWFGKPHYGFIVTPLFVDFNHTKGCHRYMTFPLQKGKVPDWWLRNSPYKDRYAADPKPTHAGGCA
jgi:hypothetical protein